MAQEEPQDLITTEVRSYIGNEGEPLTGDPITAKDIRRFALSLSNLNPLYHDEAYAKKSRHGGIIAPPTYVIWSVHPVAGDSPPDPEGTGRGLASIGTPPKQPPVSQARVVRGGDELEFFEPIRVGDVITSKARLADIYQRRGRSGPLVFTVIETTYTNQRGQVVAIHRGTFIARH